MPLPRIKIRALQALIAVYEEQSFSGAAERENATQSGMSTQVKNLETLLNVQLLERKRGAADLTPAGQIVYFEGRKILRQLFELEQRVAEHDAGLSGSIRIGIIPSLTRSVLPGAMLAYQRTNPYVEVSVLEEYSFSLMRRVVEGELDCALVPAGDVLRGLSATYIATDHEVLAVSQQGLPDRTHLSPVTPANLNGLKLIMPSARNIRRRGLSNFFDAHNVEIADVLEMDAMLATLEYVTASDWAAVLPSVLLHPDIKGGARKLHPLMGPGITTDYIMVQKTEKSLAKAAQAFVDAIKIETERLLAEWQNAIAEDKTC